MSETIRHADGRIELQPEALREIETSPLYNEDLAPVPVENRNWTTYNYAALWISMAHCIPTYMMASSLTSVGMNWWQALVTILLGNIIVLAPILLNSHPGTKYGIPFPVFARASYGAFGSNLPALMRAIVACGWFGIQAWIGGQAIHIFLGSIIPGWNNLLGGAVLDGHTPTEWISFLLFWALNIAVVYRGMNLLRHVENWAAPFVLVMTAALLFWILTQAGGIGFLFHEQDKFQTFSEFFKIFIPSLTAMIGFWATLSLNMPDFTRFGKSQREQAIGQVVALPTTMVLFAAMGILITSAAVVVFPNAKTEELWDPVKLVGQFTQPLVVAVSMFTIIVATLSVNIAANVVSPANDFANAFPRFISFRTGGLITGVIGILMMPWKLLADPSGYIFSWLLGYSGGLGSIAGVLIADYWFIRNKNLNLGDLYRPRGIYRGWNWRAVAATLLGCFFAWIGLLIPALRVLYDYAWFVGFGVSFAAHFALTKIFPQRMKFSGRKFMKYEKIKNYYDGKFVESGSDESLEVVSPIDGNLLSKVPMSGADELNAAVESAKNAFENWSNTPIKERVQVFFRYRYLLEKNFEELTNLVSEENGKTHDEAKAEVEKSIELTEFACSMPQLVAGEILEVSKGVECRTEHYPLGVVASIVPFNFPLMVPNWTMPNALVLGNTMIMKPSELVPLSCQRMAELLKEAGLPDGVFNVVNGGKEIVEAICAHQYIEAVSFVGSTKVARIVYQRATHNLKRCIALGGAKNHLFVLPDANAEMTATNVTASMSGCAGQRCMAASAMLAVGDVDPIISRICTEARKIIPGKNLGAVISKAAKERIENYISEAESNGAKILVDGRGARVEGKENGTYVGATVIDFVTPEMSVATEEIFGPVISIMRTKNLDEALKIENANPYGNAASVFTQSGGAARYVIEKASAGMVGVNVGVPVPREPFSFGGWNDSRFGANDITGKSSIEFWTKLKKTTTKWNAEAGINWMS